MLGLARSVKPHRNYQLPIQARPHGGASSLFGCGVEYSQAAPASLPVFAEVRILRSERRYERMDITGLTRVTAAQRAALVALGAVDQGPQAAANEFQPLSPAH
jgi:hypothetical protein